MSRFVPTPKQQLFLTALKTADEVGFGGARGPGKTLALCHAMWILSTEYPGNRGLVVRQSFTDLLGTTLKEFKAYLARYVPEALPFVSWRMYSPVTCQIRVGGAISEIEWRDAGDPEKHLSANLAWCAIDEGTQVSLEFVNIIRAALGRWKLPDGRTPPSRLMWASNPGPGWAKTEFPVGGKPAYREYAVTREDGTPDVVKRAFVPALPRDNPHLTPGWVDRLRIGKPTAWVKRWLEGDWSAFEGQVFGEFDAEAHVLPYVPGKSELDPDWLYILSHDWGHTAPAATLLMCCDFSGNWTVLGEVYAAGLLPKDHAPLMQELLTLAPVPVAAQVIDYAAQDQLSGTSLQSIYNLHHGFQFQPCSKNKHGVDGTIFFLKGLLGDKKIRIAPTCTNLIRELQEAQWSQLSLAQMMKRDPQDKMQDKNDHAIDSLFMGLEYWRAQPKELDPDQKRQRARSIEHARIIAAARISEQKTKQDEREAAEMVRRSLPGYTPGRVRADGWSGL